MSQLLKVPFSKICRALLLVSAVQLAACGSPEQRAQSYYERGQEYLTKKDNARASVEFRNALRLNEKLVGAWLGLAQIEEQNQNWQPLARILRKVVELEPKNLDATLRLTRLMLLGNALDEALKLANAAADLEPKNANVLTTRAAVLLRLDDNAGAVREAKTALEISPSNAEALSVLAAERLKSGDAEGALKILERESTANADNFGLQLFRMSIYERLGNLQQVEALLRRFVELYPQEPAFRRQLVKLYGSQKRLDEAEQELRAIAAANPTNVEAGLDIVRFLNVVKGPEAALQELQARVKAGGEVFQYQLALAEFYFAQGKVADSFQLLESLAKGAASQEQAIQAQIKLAEMNLGLKKLDDANTVVANILSKDGRNIAGLRLRAAIRTERGQYDEAIADLRQALNDQPRSTPLMLQLAVAYERSGSIELAEKQFADATRLSSFDAAVGLDYVAFLRRRGSAAHAEEVLNELVTRWPNNTRVLTVLAEVRLARQNWVGAQEVAELIRRNANNQGLADQVLGAALSGRNRYDESIAALQRAYSETSAAPQPMFALVGTMVRAKQTDRAVAFLKDVLKSNPNNAEALVLLGSTQLVLNQPELALESFRTAIEKQPKNMIGYRALADYYLGQRKNEEALKIIEEALKAQPQNFAMRLYLAGVLEVKADYEGAIAQYETLLSQQSGSLVVANNLASLLTDRRTDKASLDRAYNLALGLRKSQVAQFKDTLGWVQHQRGDHKAAVLLLEEAAAELPNLAMVRYHLGMSYLSSGQLAKASEQLQKAVELSANDPELSEKAKAALKKVGAS